METTALNHRPASMHLAVVRPQSAPSKLPEHLFALGVLVAPLQAAVIAGLSGLPAIASIPILMLGSLGALIPLWAMQRVRRFRRAWERTVGEGTDCHEIIGAQWINNRTNKTRAVAVFTAQRVLLVPDTPSAPILPIPFSEMRQVRMSEGIARWTHDGQRFATQGPVDADGLAGIFPAAL